VRMMKVGCFAFIFFICVVGIVSNKKEVQSRITEEVKKWQHNFSGKPVNCVPGQFLFTGSAIFESSNGTKLNSLSRIFHHCKSHWEESFQQMDIFITSPLYFNDHSVSFSRSILFLTHENCRITCHGTTIISFTNEYKISKWQDFYDADLLATHRGQCDLSSFEVTEDKSKQEL